MDSEIFNVSEMYQNSKDGKCNQIFKKEMIELKYNDDGNICFIWDEKKNMYKSVVWIDKNIKLWTKILSILPLSIKKNIDTNQIRLSDINWDVISAIRLNTKSLGISIGYNTKKNVLDEFSLNEYLDKYITLQPGVTNCNNNGKTYSGFNNGFSFRAGTLDDTIEDAIEIAVESDSIILFAKFKTIEFKNMISLLILNMKHDGMNNDILDKIKVEDSIYYFIEGGYENENEIKYHVVRVANYLKCDKCSELIPSMHLVIECIDFSDY